MKNLFALTILLVASFSYSQIGITTNSPNNSAILDLSNTNNKGFLLPKVALTSTIVSDPIVAPAVGLQVYNTATVADVAPGFYYWDGAKWVSLITRVVSNSLSGTNLFTTVDGVIGTPVDLALTFAAGVAWSTFGNTGTIPGTHFVGTRDNSNLVFKRNNVFAGAIGSNSVSLGTSALPSNSGDFNTALGYSTLHSNSSGTGNTAIGSYALSENSSTNFNTAVGYHALINSSATGNTGIGTYALNGNTTGSNNTALGLESLYHNAYGNNNTAVGYKAIDAITSGSNNIGIGYNAQVPNNTESNQVRIGDTNISYAGIQVGWTISSDRRWKNNITDSNLGINFIKTLRPVSYLRNNDESNKTEYGFIAQEFEEALNKAGISKTGMISKDDNGLYSLRYNDLFAPIIKAIQEQQKQIDEKDAKIHELENKNIEMEKRLQKLETEIQSMQR